VKKHLSRADEPTTADLATIEDEASLIAAELDWLDAEITMLNADERGGPVELDWQRLRSAEARVIRETLTYVARLTRKPLPRLAA
jgi:hypothetical protein